LLGKIELQIILVLDMVICCVLLHNMVIAKKEIDMDSTINSLAKETKVEQLWKAIGPPSCANRCKKIKGHLI